MCSTYLLGDDGCHELALPATSAGSVGTGGGGDALLSGGGGKSLLDNKLTAPMPCADSRFLLRAGTAGGVAPTVTTAGSIGRGRDTLRGRLRSVSECDADEEEGEASTSILISTADADVSLTAAPAWRDAETALKGVSSSSSSSMTMLFGMGFGSCASFISGAALSERQSAGVEGSEEEASESDDSDVRAHSESIEESDGRGEVCASTPRLSFTFTFGGDGKEEENRPGSGADIGGAGRRIYEDGGADTQPRLLVDADGDDDNARASSSGHNFGTGLRLTRLARFCARGVVEAGAVDIPKKSESGVGDGQRIDVVGAGEVARSEEEEEDAEEDATFISVCRW